MPEPQEQMLVFLQDLAANPPPLPCEPTLIPLLFAATRANSKASVDDLTRLIEKSQKLASKVLALANSPAYRLGSPVSSLARAVSVLGFDEVRALVIMASAASMAEGSPLPVQFKLLDLWQHQITTASLIKSLAIVVNKTTPSSVALFDPDEMYAAGLLHDIGKVLLAVYLPDVWVAIDALARKNALPFAAAEEAYWGLQHGTSAALVLRTWQLPSLLTDMIEWHHCPQEALGHKREAHLLAAADLLAHSPPLEGVLPPEVFKHLPLDSDHALIGQISAEVLASENARHLAEALA